MAKLIDDETETRDTRANNAEIRRLQDSESIKAAWLANAHADENYDAEAYQENADFQRECRADKLATGF